MVLTLERKMEICGSLNEMGQSRGQFGIVMGGVPAYQTSKDSKPILLEDDDLEKMHHAALVKYEATLEYARVSRPILDERIVTQAQNVQAELKDTESSE